MTTTREFLRLLAGAVAAMAALPAARADDYPSRPVRLIVGFPPGQGSDSIARAVAQRMQALLGGSWFVENRTGASGSLAQQAAAAAPADGYTVLLTSAGPMAVNEGVNEKLPYSPLKDYASIGGISIFPMVLVCNPSFAARTVQELVALAKTKPTEINYASSGAGLTAHMSMELLSLQAGIKLTHVPYKGTALAMGDVLSGRVSLMFDTPIAVLPLVRDGRLRAIAAGGKSRLASLPNVPTVAESGYPGFLATSWTSLVAPANTPAPVIARLSEALAKVVGSADMRSYLRGLESEPMPMNPAQLDALLRQEIDKWTATAKSAGVRGKHFE
jgi:tripartite-type tricarboxylate transporter receptor subunit TctC